MSFRRRLILGSQDALVDMTKVAKVDFGEADLVGSGWSIVDGTFTGDGGGGGGSDDDYISSTAGTWSTSNTNYAMAKIDFSPAIEESNYEPLIKLDQYTQIQKCDYGSSPVSHGLKIASQVGLIVEVNSDGNTGEGDRLIVINNGTTEFYVGNQDPLYSKRAIETDVGYRVSTNIGINTTKVFEDNSGATHTVTVTGGIITSWTVS